ncbi:MAG: molybdenum cofactor guanylyltransferase MobA [gamma proteobacterium symbiont of Bathyaustriella thionipta]|nr:molybdenum cofactor guanylyltransferase MobA [gamma proteobacterium symbiont of Bathyaustriella thionipta]MCU7948731.1 molybdenum cofactor guanylyltransferase MobA [gamma proteobacterium symbiont of Bathyaustriella thionipta]MCU7954634.1 molybdenum cofactor guanylyltransferase MobA [gamma proteobacterium symbiont of Bathyaustriella thionipta]MCU7955214.1 molybdenum cofactor guanylyltransferase MobA [gamma proteobacterium symbiont of Bathyaustriella thionipta]MCU7968238.1 molybdenum cofactor 
MQITGLILAGGRSSRMKGHDKGLLKLLERPMIDYVIDRLKPQVEQILISANRHIDTYQKFGYEVLLDDYDDYRGPLAGMSRGLAHSKSEYLLTVPCDGPLLPMDLASRMLDFAQQKNVKAVLAFDGQYKQPTYNLIHKDLLTHLTRSLENNEHKLGKWLMDNGALKLDFSDQKSAFLNVNTPDDLDLLCGQLTDNFKD